MTKRVFTRKPLSSSVCSFLLKILSFHFFVTSNSVFSSNEDFSLLLVYVQEVKNLISKVLKITTIWFGRLFLTFRHLLKRLIKTFEKPKKFPKVFLQFLRLLKCQATIKTFKRIESLCRLQNRTFTDPKRHYLEEKNIERHYLEENILTLYMSAIVIIF